MTTPTQAHLSYTTTATNVSPAELADAMAAVPLYTDPGADPVLKVLFDSTVADDETTISNNDVTRTLTLDLGPTFAQLFPTPSARAGAFNGLFQSTLAQFLSAPVRSNPVAYT